MLALFCGLRGSEIRGLAWRDIDFKAGTLTIRQRADAYRAVGSPKSAGSRRTVPLSPMTVNALREHKLASPSSPDDLVFQSRDGRPLRHEAIVEVGWKAAQRRAFGRVKYRGLHACRHFFASWNANSRENGGLGRTLQETSRLLGHASVAQTSECYSHLFPRSDDADVLAAGELALMNGT